MSYGKRRRTGYDPASIQEYTFPIENIPRLSARDPEVYRLIQASRPVVISDSGLINSALKWNLGYLQENLGDGSFHVYGSKDNRFKYYDEKRAKQCKSFPKPVKRYEVSFNDFLKMLMEKKNTRERIYLQQMLNESVGQEIVKDYVDFNWDWVGRIQNEQGWGPLSSNLLLIGLEGNITPVHYDEQENFFSQISGYKRCLLFSPDQFENLYPHPVAHPCDRQSQVDFSKPDFERFPKFRNARAMEAIVGPGDVLYIPMYWWHQVESLKSLSPIDHKLRDFSTTTSSGSSGDIPPVTVSVNFWYRAAPLPATVKFPISAQQRVSVMRNIEKLLASALGSADEVGKLLSTMVDGRYNEE
ncbi:hypoxia-inducible factor 1-alpha inhibitor-like [Clavelina lepadiformis]|uniref:JmjC domain-containing protein n=1 Tax=Clavelina lepadiformis TaxID=159417 RepID=A0ABP0FX59_CLALP